jgi:dipeptidyl aminopeptidase/acylaminoacyl peptidase
LTSFGQTRNASAHRLCAYWDSQRGAVATIYSSNERFRAAYGPTNAEFHIGLYTPRNVTYKEDNKVGNKPISLFHGIADDYVSIEPCRSYVKRLKEAGADVTLTEYPDAHHFYDNFTLASSVEDGALG